MIHTLYPGSTRWRFVLLLMFISAVIAARYMGLTDYIHIDHIWHHKDTLTAFVANNYWLAVLAFIALNMLVVIFAVPVSIALNVAAGYFFGVIPAVIYCNIASAGGALIAFLIFRYVLSAGLHKRYHDTLERFNKKFEEDGVSYLLFMQLLPVTPFGLITVLAGLSDIPAWTFYWTTALGILPGSIIYAFAGKKMGEISSVHDILSAPMMLALLALASLALLPILVKYFKKHAAKRP
jgi:uncharacterized membrane protein YdjX (TVP38/TMEM64 family)